MDNLISVVPITTDGKIVMIEQQHRTDSDCHLEFPGGLIGTVDIDPSISAQRELSEETGYHAKRLVNLGIQLTSPNEQVNRLHTYLALDCEKCSEQDLEPSRNSRIRLLQIDCLIDISLEGDEQDTIMQASLLAALPALKRLWIYPLEGNHDE